MIDTREYISNLDIPEKVTLFKKLYNELAGYGMDGDTELAHVNTFEASLLKSLGGSGTINEVTGLKEYKGGGGSPPPAPPAQQSVTQTSEFPTELKPFIKDVLTEGQTEFQREQAEGFQTFPGPQLAQFTPEQQAAFAAGREQFTGLAGTPLGQAATYYQPALAATALGTAEIGPEDIQRRMDPFLQNVVDIAKREARSDEDIARQQRAAQAVAGQGFLGGTRPAFVEAQAEQDLAERLGDIQARGLSASFQQAQQAAEQQRAREMAGGRQFGALGDATGARARGDIAGLAGIGETQQQRSQQALDIAQREFEEERAFPQAALQRYASLIRGFPLQATQQQFSTQTIPTPSFAQTLAGGIQTGLGTYGMFGGFRNKGGLVSLQGGGLPGAQYTKGDVGGAASAPMPMHSQFPGADQENIALEMLRRRGAAIRQATVPQVPQVSMPIGDPRLNNRVGTALTGSEGGLMSIVKRQEGDSLTLGRGELRKRQEELENIRKGVETKLGAWTPEQIAAEREAWYAERERKDAERDAIREQQKQQSFWAGLAASGAGTLAADPRKGVWGAVGEGFQAGLPTWMEGMSEYAKAEERAFERGEDREAQERSEEIESRSIELDRELQKLQLARASATEAREILSLDAQIENNILTRQRLDLAMHPSQRPAVDRRPLEALAGRLLYPGQHWENIAQYETAIASVVDEAKRRLEKEYEGVPVSLGGAAEEERLFEIIQEIINTGGTPESTSVQRRTEQDTINAQDAMNTWAG